MSRAFRIVAVLVLLVVATLGAHQARAAAPVGTEECSGVRPGALIMDPGGDSYTMGFMYSGSLGGERATYFVTVQDLALQGPLTRVWPAGVGPAVTDTSGRQIGRYVYSFSQDNPFSDSFGLVRLDDGVAYSPAVCHFGGPTGVYTPVSPVPTVMQFYGQVAGFGAARSGAVFPNDPGVVFAVAPTGPGLDDEGSPALVGGQALGVFSGGVGAYFLPPSAGVSVSRLGPEVARAEKMTGISLRLLTAPAQ